ncbi:MAG: glycosyltransferase family 9 protein [Betaproteobacteria bacterium HGW-Betaproteobacteria-11]|nr:MAG: glycosyltransferase family 9 protein [Betaproteobacteria bacterium HGW-Betaproteobacteria-11]
MRLNLRENLLYLVTRLLARRDRRARAAADYRPERVRRILLVSSTALGDTVLSTAAMVAMRRRFPVARIAALIHRDYLPLFRDADFLDEVIPYHGGWRHFIATLWRLRRFHPDLALILHGNEPQATPLAYLAGARFIFKLPNTSRFAFLLTNHAPHPGWADCGHGLNLRLKIAGLAGAEVAGARMGLPVPAATRVAVANWLAGQGVAAADTVIGLQAGASSRGRMWPVAHFVALARQLLAVDPAYRFIITGAPHEGPRCDEIAEGIGFGAVVAAGALPIEMLPALVQRCAVLVTGDTGTLHMAVAIGVPTVSLFAVSGPAVSGPAYDFDKHIVIHRPAAVTVSSKTDNDRWMAEIPPEDVLPAVLRLIDSDKEHKHE